MSNRSAWSLAIVNKRSAGRIRSVAVPPLVAIICGIILLGGLGGFCRLGFFAFSYAYGRIGVYHEQHQNRILLNKLQFLSKYIKREDRHSQLLSEAENALRMKYGLDPITSDVRAAGVGGKPTTHELMAIFSDPTVAKADSVKEQIQALLRRTQLQAKTFSTVRDHIKDKATQFTERPSIWPVHGRITSGFGFRIHPILGYTVFHEGLDIANEVWTPVFATADGVVSFVGNEDYYGNMVVVDHRSTGLRSVFAHFIQPATLVEGQAIKRGDLVGYMGNSGRSTGNHLHYEIRKSDKPVDPLNYIVPADVIID